MFITVSCPSCGRRYDVPGKLAGRKVRCKECATQFRMPVPQTIPREETPKRGTPDAPSLEAQTLAEILDAKPGDPPEPPRPTLEAVGLLPDWGETWTYRIVQIALIAILALAWYFRLGSPLGIAVWLALILGAFLLLPLLAGWPSFEESRQARIIGRFAGLDGTRATQATLGVALWIFAVLITLDAIHIEALEPWPEPEAAAEETPIPVKGLPTPAP